MEAGRTLDGEPGLPVEVAHLVHLPEPPRADLLPAAEFALLEGFQQSHGPRGTALPCHPAAAAAPRPPPGTAVRSAAATARPGESGVTGGGGTGVASLPGPGPPPCLVPSCPVPSPPPRGAERYYGREWGAVVVRYPGSAPRRSALLGPSEAAKMSPGSGRRLVSSSRFSWQLQRTDRRPRGGSPAATLLSPESWGSSRVAAAPKAGSGGAARVS